MVRQDNTLRKIILFFLWASLAALILGLLNSSVLGILIYVFGFVFVPVLVMSALVVSLISRSSQWSRTALILVIGMSVALPIFIVTPLAKCEGLECIGAGFALMIASAVWIISAGSVPILLTNAFWQNEDLIYSRKFWLAGIFTLMSIFIIAVLTYPK